MAVPFRSGFKLYFVTTLLTISLIFSILATILVAIGGDNPHVVQMMGNTSNPIIEVENSIADNYLVIRVFHAILLLISDLILIVLVIYVHINRRGSGHSIILIVLFVVMVFLLWRPSMFSSIVHQIIVILCYVYCLMIGNRNGYETDVKESTIKQ